MIREGHKLVFESEVLVCNLPFFFLCKIPFKLCCIVCIN